MSRNRILIIVAASTIAAFAVIILTTVGLIMFKPDLFFNKYLKEKVEARFAEINPATLIHIHALHYHFWYNEIDADTIEFYNKDSTLMGSITDASLIGIKFMHLLKGGPDDKDISQYIVQVKSVYIPMPNSDYDIHFKKFNLSLSDSQITLEDFDYNPRDNDETFFAASDFRQTRLRISIPSIQIQGIEFAKYIQHKILHIHSLKVSHARLDILMNKDKMVKIDSTINPMPNELFNRLNNAFLMDSMTIDNGEITYNQRFEIEGKKASITMNHLDILALQNTDTIRKYVNSSITANFKINNITPINVSMQLPLSSKVFSLRYSGTCGSIVATDLNNYLDNAETIKMKSGKLESAAFDIDITNGKATGNIRAIYTDLKIEPSNFKTSQSKTRRGINTFLANTFALHKNNVADKKGVIKPGIIKFSRAHDTAFIEMIWLSLRSGLEDITGI
jgi:pyrimidine operon attenuation protein/uracil phosphoribosyltransferase